MSRFCRTVNVVLFDQSLAVSEDVNAALVAVEYFITAYRGIAVRRHPDAGESVVVDFVVDELQARYRNNTLGL